MLSQTGRRILLVRRSFVLRSRLLTTTHNYNTSQSASAVANGAARQRAQQMEKAKIMNESLQAGLKPKPTQPPIKNPTRTTGAATTAAELPDAAARQKRLYQAIINGVFSFMVVLLAAQNLKAGTELKNTLDHLEAATKVLEDKKEKLRRVAQRETADQLAAICREHVAAAEKESATTWFGASSKSSVAIQQQELAVELQQKLQDIVGDAALTPDEMEKKEVEDMVATIESPQKRRVFTI